MNMQRILPCEIYKNVLILKDQLGHSKPTIYQLPSEQFVYGKEETKDKENAKQLISSWQIRKQSQGPSPQRNFVDLNKMAIQRNNSTNKQFTQFRKYNNSQSKINKGKQSFPIFLPQQKFRYGIHSKYLELIRQPQNFTQIIQNNLGRSESLNNQIKYQMKFIDGQNKSPKLNFFKSHKLRCQVNKFRIKQLPWNSSKNEQWKLNRFLSINSKIKSQSTIPLTWQHIQEGQQNTRWLELKQIKLNKLCLFNVQNSILLFITQILVIMLWNGNSNRVVTQANENQFKVEVEQDKALKKSNYQFVKIIGTGTFGKVYLVVALLSRQLALKQVFQDKKYKNRQLQIIQQLNHPNIVKLQNYYFTTGERVIRVDQNHDQYLNLVMDYLPQPLSKLIRKVKRQKYAVPTAQLKIITFQLLRALNYLQSVGICHRDIKPQNILYHPQKHLIKICDLGSAKKIVEGQKNIAYICSRYYRAPELIFGKTFYKFYIDVWSMGCVFCQLISGQPIFQGQSPMKQLIQIMKILGTPSTQQLSHFQGKKQVKLPQFKAVQLKKVFTKYKVQKDFIDLIQKMLVYIPNKRIRPLQALLHPWFNFSQSQKKSMDDIFFKLLPCTCILLEQLGVIPQLKQKLYQAFGK